MPKIGDDMATEQDGVVEQIDMMCLVNAGTARVYAGRERGVNAGTVRAYVGRGTGENARA